MASGKTLQSTIEISGVLSPSLQAAINSAIDRLADMAEETLESADAASRLVAEMSEQENVLSTLQKAYAGYVANGEESGTQAQELANKIKVVSGELEENREILQAAEKAAKDLTDSQENAADAYTKLENKIESQQDELAALRRQYSNVVLEQGESSDEARQLASRISDLSGELSQNEQQLREAERAADAFADSLDEAEESAESSSEGYTVLKGVLANLVSEGIDKAVEGFKEMAFEGDTALAKLEAKTGATGEKIQGFEDIMYEVYNANYGESLGDVSDVLSTVIQMTDDLDNASLAQITKNSIALNDVFGFDTTESLRAVNSLMDQFGITSEQAYNLIVQGAQNGLNQNDDLLDTINEYSVQFKNAGYSADDMLNMLLNGTETGTWSVDKLGDAVKEFNIRMSDGTANDYLSQLGVDVDSVMEKFNKGGPEAQEAIDTVMDAILECDDATLQYQTGVGLFGTMWEDLGADAVASLMTTEGSIDSASDAMAQMDEAAYDTLEGSLSKLGRTIKAEVVQPIADKLTPVIKDAVDVVTTKVGPAVDWVLDHLPAIGIALGTVGAIIAAMKWGKITSQIGKITSAFSSFKTALTAIPGPVLVIIGIVAALAAGFAYLWKTNEDFRENMTEVWEQLKETFSEVGDTLSSTLEQLAPLLSEVATTVLTALGELAGAIIPVLADLITSILPFIIDLISELIPVLVEIIEAVLPVVIDLINELVPIIVQIIEAVLPVVIDLINALLPIVMQIIETVLPVIIDLIKQLLPFVIQIIEAVLPVIIDLINALLPVVMQIIEMVLPVIIDLINALLPVVRQIIEAVLPVIIDLIIQLLPFIIQIVEMVLPILIQLINMLLPIIMQIITAILPIILQLIQALLPVILQIIQMVLPILIQILNLLTPILNLIIALLMPILNLIFSLVMPILNLIFSAITPLIEIFMTLITSILQPIMPIISAVATVITAVLGVAIETIQPIIESLQTVFQGLIDFITGVFSGNWSQAWDGVVQVFSGIWDTLVDLVKAPINGVIGLINSAIGALNNISVTIPDWVPEIGGETYGINLSTIPLLASGGFTDGVSIAGEAGMEAVISFDSAYRDRNIGIWEKAGQLLGVLGNEEQGAGLTSKAGELLTLDDFSLGSLADGTSIVIYYDFSGFTWSPQIQSGNGEDEDDLLARLSAHEAEFFDWLEEFIQMREVAQYA